MITTTPGDETAINTDSLNLKDVIRHIMGSPQYQGEAEALVKRWLVLLGDAMANAGSQLMKIQAARAALHRYLIDMNDWDDYEISHYVSPLKLSTLPVRVGVKIMMDDIRTLSIINLNELPAYMELLMMLGNVAGEKVFLRSQRGLRGWMNT